MSESLKLANGVEMPAIGFGAAFGNWTDRSKFFGFTPEEGYKAVPLALKTGYRHIDTAHLYGTQKVIAHSIGAALAAGTLSRSDLFITTKLFHTPTEVAYPCKGFPFATTPLDQIKETILRQFYEALDELTLGYVDLLLMHWPGEFGTTDKELGDKRRQLVWEAFEEIHATGRARAIGVSNFQQEHLESILKTCKVKPMVNQIEVSPFITQRPLVDYCQAQGVVVFAWAPFGSGATGVLENATLKALAAKHSKNVGQVILRWLLQLGIGALPKSTSEARMLSNLDVFDFQLTEEEVQSISALDQGKSSVGAPTIA